MTQSEILSLAPELILTGAGILILLLEAFAPALRRAFTALALVAVAAAGAAAAVMVPAGATFDGLLEANGVTLAFSLVVLLGTFLGLASSQGFLVREHLVNGEYHALFLWCAAGMLVMLRSTELLTVFLALELLSLCLYALAAFHRRVVVGTEAAIKYFLMGAFASAFVLLGVALVYGESGSTQLDRVAAAFASAEAMTPVAALGILLLVAGFGFKMSVVPFHAWSPDTYQGAPSPFVAFLSVAPKAAAALVLMRVLGLGMESSELDWDQLVALLAVLSMVVGNLFALVQKDIKRMLAYSGIAHMGYLLIALVNLDGGGDRLLGAGFGAAEAAGGPSAVPPVVVYLLAYTLMNAGAFAVVALLYPHSGGKHLISDLAGQGYRRPLLSACLAVFMLSLGGLPPTAGFIGKYLVFLHAVAHGWAWLAVVGVLASLVGVFYYLRVVYTLYMSPETREAPAAASDPWGMAAVVVSAIATLVLGVWPGALVAWMTAAVERLG